MHRSIPAVLAALLLFASAGASAFNSDEHKMIGDYGSGEVPVCGAQAAPGCRGAQIKSKQNVVLVKTMSLATAKADKVFRLVDVDQAQFVKDRSAAYKDMTSGSWYDVVGHYISKILPPPAALTVAKAPLPILVWVGDSTDAANGEFFTFGDLIALYGDYRVPVTCGADETRCLLSDKLDANTSKQAAYLKNFVRGEVPPYGAAGNAIMNSKWLNDPTDLRWWGDEMLRIAKVNDWHFARRAIAWYIGMHRQALVMAALAAEKKDPTYLWKALHYEANGLHSLTDLFAPGHVITVRDGTIDGIYNDTYFLSRRYPLHTWYRAVLDKSGDLQPLKPPSHAASVSGAGDWAIRAKAEESTHTAFNTNGSRVRNARALGTSAQKDATFASFGDGLLFLRKGNKADGAWLNQTEWSWTRRAVKDSLVALFTAAAALEKVAGNKQQLEAALQKQANSPAFWEALKDVPIEVQNACYAPKKCYATNQWLRAVYADQVLDMIGVNLATQTLKEVTGADWLGHYDSGGGTTMLQELQK